MSVIKKEILFELENCNITVYTDGKIEIAWGSDISIEKASLILERLNKYIPTKKRWSVTGNIASTELNSFEADLFETFAGERERLQFAADIPV